MSTQNNNPKGIVFILIAMMVFSVQDGIMKHIYNFVSLYEIYLIRTVVSFVLILLFLIITKKPIIPSDDEIKINRKARSAKLRIAKRTKFSPVFKHEVAA